jgi:hypothetical protein
MASCEGNEAQGKLAAFWPRADGPLLEQQARKAERPQTAQIVASCNNDVHFWQPPWPKEECNGYF